MKVGITTVSDTLVTILHAILSAAPRPLSNAYEYNVKMASCTSEPKTRKTNQYIKMTSITTNPSKTRIVHFTISYDVKTI